MPIYAYRCESCGHAKDVLQKISDPLLTVCPACGAASFKKQVTAAGFQLKGSGWYVTDFRGGNNSGGPAKPAGTGAESAAGEGGSGGSSTDAAPATSSPAPAAGSGGDAAKSSPSPAAKAPSSDKP
jgi:putative FmdB family regulatory protein